MSNQLKNSLESVCKPQQQQQNRVSTPSKGKVKPLGKNRQRALILEAEQLEEYANALEAIEE
jgi:hypothetical protein